MRNLPESRHAPVNSVFRCLANRPPRCGQPRQGREYAPHAALFGRGAGQMGSNDLLPYAPSPPSASRPPHTRVTCGDAAGSGRWRGGGQPRIASARTSSEGDSDGGSAGSAGGDPLGCGGAEAVGSGGAPGAEGDGDGAPGPVPPSWPPAPPPGRAEPSAPAAGPVPGEGLPPRPASRPPSRLGGGGGEADAAGSDDGPAPPSASAVPPAPAPPAASRVAPAPRGSCAPPDAAEPPSLPVAAPEGDRRPVRRRLGPAVGHAHTTTGGTGGDQDRHHGDGPPDGRGQPAHEAPPGRAGLPGAERGVGGRRGYHRGRRGSPGAGGIPCPTPAVPPGTRPGGTPVSRIPVRAAARRRCRSGGRSRARR